MKWLSDVNKVYAGHNRGGGGGREKLRRVCWVCRYQNGRRKFVPQTCKCFPCDYCFYTDLYCFLIGINSAFIINIPSKPVPLRIKTHLAQECEPSLPPPPKKKRYSKSLFIALFKYRNFCEKVIKEVQAEVVTFVHFVQAWICCRAPLAASKSGRINWGIELVRKIHKWKLPKMQLFALKQERKACVTPFSRYQ